MNGWVLKLLFFSWAYSSFADDAGVFQVYHVDASQYNYPFQGVGTASLVDRQQRLFLTAAHVVKDAYARAESEPDGTKRIFIRLAVANRAVYIPVTNVYSGFSKNGADSDQDFALLKLADDSKAELLDAWNEIPLSEVSLKDTAYSVRKFPIPSLEVFGFPSGKTNCFHDVASFASETVIGRRRWRIKFSAFGGESGGPCLFNDELAAIVIAQDDNPKGDYLGSTYCQVLSIADILTDIAAHVPTSPRVKLLINEFNEGIPDAQNTLIYVNLRKLNAIERIQLILGLSGQDFDKVKLLAELIDREPNAKISSREFYLLFPRYAGQSIQSVKEVTARLDRGEYVPLNEVKAAYNKTSVVVENLAHFEQTIPDKRVLAQAIGDYIYFRHKILKVPTHSDSERELLKYGAELDGENPQLLRAFALSDTTPPQQKPDFLTVGANKLVGSGVKLPSGYVNDWIGADGRVNSYGTACGIILNKSHLDKATARIAGQISTPGMLR
jgi:hypothetical protein